MSTLKLLEDYVVNKTKEAPQYPKIIAHGMQTVAGDVPFKLKLAITLSELITFASHLRKPIKLYDGTLVPTNAIVFALSTSGSSKDKSLNSVRGALKEGYECLEVMRVQTAEDRAKKQSRVETDSEDSWQVYYRSPRPLQSGLGTAEGLTHHFAEIAGNPLGAGSVMSSEIGTDLQTNGSMADIIKTVSIAYDLGNIPAKIIKSEENQTGTITGFPVNALFFGSQEAILFNNEIKNKFKLAFNTQLARRSLFSFTPEPPAQLNITSIDELYDMREAERKRVINAQETLRDLTKNLLSESDSTPMDLTPEANKLFDVYLEYNAIRSDNVSNKYPITKLSQRHKQWLALKLSGAYAILDGSTVVREEHYATAINTAELLASDMQKFEKELIKEPYEQLVDMCRFNAEEGTFFLSLHDLRKMSYISGTGAAKTKVEDLVVMANSCDSTGSYTSVDSGIEYKEIIKTDTTGVSYILFSQDLKDKAFKEYASSRCSEGYEFYETEFEELGDLLHENAVYTPFRFAEGRRSKDSIVGGCSWIVLDVDKSFLTYKEAHTLLNQYNHHIVQTSDPDNEFKFRALLKLDAAIDVDEFLWKALISAVGETLGLVVDSLPKSQIFISFAGREVLTQLEGETLPSKQLLESARTAIKDKPKPVASLPSKARQQRLDDPRDTFNFAFDAVQGERSVKLYRALAYAVDLGADAEYLTKLAHEINDYWMSSMDVDRLERTLLNPALRRLGG